MGVSMMDTSERIRDFSRKYSLTYLQFIDPNREAFSKFASIDVIPRTVIIDRNQRIVLRELGYTEKRFETIVKTVKTLVIDE